MVSLFRYITFTPDFALILPGSGVLNAHTPFKLSQCLKHAYIKQFSLLTKRMSLLHVPRMVQSEYSTYEPHPTWLIPLPRSPFPLIPGKYCPLIGTNGNPKFSLLAL